MDSFFSQSQMAIAFAITKAMPESFTINEYTTELHKAIAPTSATTNVPKRHIDTCGFWQGLYEKIYQDNKALRGKLRVLEEHQRILERLSSPEFGEHVGNASSRKRPAGLEEVEDWIENEGDDDVVSIGDDYLRLSSYTLRIGRTRHDVERFIKNPSVPEYTDTLSTTACELLNLLETALNDFSIPLSTLKFTDESRTVLLLQQMMHQITLSYLISFQALEELARTIPGRKKRFAVAHSLVTFFSKALDYLHSLSEMQAEQELQDRSRLRNKRARKAEGEYAINKFLCRTLVQICQMDWKVGQLAHSEILEGILCSVLTRTAHLLSHVIFKEHVAGSGKVGNISVDKLASSTVATKFEFRYIIPILHAALGGSERKDLVAKVLAGSRRSTISQAKKLVQETLLKGAVGDADMEGLKLPEVPSDEMFPIIQSGVYDSEQYGSEWFLEAVWALVGWELVV